MRDGSRVICRAACTHRGIHAHLPPPHVLFCALFLALPLSLRPAVHFPYYTLSRQLGTRDRTLAHSTANLVLTLSAPITSY